MMALRGKAENFPAKIVAEPPLATEDQFSDKA